MNLGVTTSFSDTSGCNGESAKRRDSHQSTKASPNVRNNNRESVDLIDDSVDKAADATLSDSFLERAMDTHMSADEDEDKVVSKKETFLRPSPALRTPRRSPAGTPTTDTPRSERSSRRLAAMRRRAKGEEARKASKISPGLLILSDSDSDCLAQSPLTPKARRAPLKDTQSGVPMPLPSSSLNVIDVCSDRSAFETFSKEWKARDSFAMALACTKVLA